MTLLGQKESGLCVCVFVAQSAGGSLIRALELDTPNVRYNIDTIQSITLQQRR